MVPRGDVGSQSAPLQATGRAAMVRGRMTVVRSVLLHCLPKVALSRACGAACSMPLPRWLRPRLFGWFARRYGADLAEADGDLVGFRSMQAFFQRPLRPGARAVADTPLVWPCDGRVVTVGPVVGGRIAQVKGRDYSLADLLGDTALAASLAGGTQATIYLAPGDYHRVHAPFAAAVHKVVALPGTLFPVNPPAVRCIRDLFARNSRHVFHCELPDGVPAAIVMVGAYNVGHTTITVAAGAVRRGDEVGRFGFGSTAIVVVGKGGPQFAAAAPEQVVRMGGAANAG
jgi:phosphatidylserine decarboxylase